MVVREFAHLCKCHCLPLIVPRYHGKACAGQTIGRLCSLLVRLSSARTHTCRALTALICSAGHLKHSASIRSGAQGDRCILKQLSCHQVGED
jgi:hypothetical protein